MNTTVILEIGLTITEYTPLNNPFLAPSPRP